MHDNHDQGDILIWNFGACRGNNLIKLQVFLRQITFLFVF